LKTPDQAIGKATPTSLHQNTRKRPSPTNGASLIGSRLDQQDERIRRADGQSRWVTATKVPLRDERGTVVGLVGSAAMSPRA